MGKKGLSFEEKRARMLEFFYEKKEVLTLKELEKVMPKLKGIVMQSVKEVLQSLVDDNLVDHDKIGAGNFYWALPSSAVVKRTNLREQLLENIKNSNMQLEQLNEQIKEARQNRVESEERSEKLKRLAEMRQSLAELNEKITSFQQRGPQKMKNIEQNRAICKDSITSWTDNIFAVKDFFKTARPDLTDAQFFEYFGLDPEFDYIE